MSNQPMTKDKFINLLQSVLKEKKQSKNIEYAEPYDELYNKCVLGYDISYTKKTYEENKFSFKTENQIEGSSHLKNVLETLIDCYGKEAIVQVLKDL